MSFAYTVRITFTDPAVMTEFEDWLRNGHIDDVIRAGAQSASLVRVDEPAGLEVRYRFADREAFAAYERDHAASLRAEGLQKFPTDRGVTYVRSTGDLLGDFGN